MLKALAREVRTAKACLPWRLASSLGLWSGEGARVHFVIEDADWAIRWVGEHVRDRVETFAPGTMQTTVSPRRVSNRVVHFGSQYMWLVWGHQMSRSNRYVASFFHGKPEDGPDVARHIDRFMDSVPKLDRIVTAASLTEKRLLDWGVPRSKLVRIPIGVDTSLFVPPNDSQQIAARRRFKISDGSVVVGSFQKDGVGWGDGMEPKLIKGPDVYVEAMRAMKATGLPVFAFLTGPARGYVKQGLAAAGIPFVHTYVKDHSELVSCYHALDLYLVTSREEGGPMGLMESMASGVPVVSTRVGMAPDLIADGQTGRIAEVADAQQVAALAIELVSLPNLGQLLEKARTAVKVADWSVVGDDHWTKVYQPLLVG
jgi:glycosyltransferase involved in cell wall biosynthesis